MSKTIAVYGSLKKGKYNHFILKDCKFLGETKVTGTLYKVGSYPAIIEEGSNEYVAEVYEVPDTTYQSIRNMELGAGYKEVVVNGNIVYYADDELIKYLKEYKEVIESY